MARPFPDGDMTSAAELGAVTDRSVRVWLRLPEAPSARVTLRVEGRDALTVEVPLAAEHDWCNVALPHLPDPAPNAPFLVEVAGRQLTGRLAPSPGSPAALTFGFGSCHMPYTGEGATLRVSDHAEGIYPAALAQLRAMDARLLLLIGDQIYAEHEAGISVRDDLPGDDQHPPPFDLTLAAYRRNYHGFFNQRGMRALREAIPTLCMWDDHDILDNWGTARTKTPYERRLFEAATRAYVEYQHLRNPGGELEDTPPYGWTHVHGDIGVLALDTRGARDASTGTMLSDAQWRAALDWLDGEAARDVSTLFVLSSVPVAHVARWFAALFDVLPGPYSESVRDRWVAGAFLASRDALLDALLRWEAAQPTRQVIIVSGDVHSASAFTIRQRDGAGVIQQITSSAFTTPLDRTQMLFNRVVVHGGSLFEPRYRIERHFLSLTNNLGIVRCEPLPAGGHRVRVAIRGWDRRARRLRTVGRLLAEPPGVAD